MTLEGIFSSLTPEAVNGFITSQQEEYLQLEFKTVKNSFMTVEDDKHTLAKALSGFANSSGGILIWGVNSRKNFNNIDAAYSPAEIDLVELFVSRLEELTPRAVYPPVDGVLHRALITLGEKGYALTMVPESESGPHMAKLGLNTYWKRSGDTFYQMEHFDLEDMFHRRKKPKLELFTDIQMVGPNCFITVGITNKGRGTAAAPYLAFSMPKGFRINFLGIDGNHNFGLPMWHVQNTSLPYRYGGNGDYVIHPDITLEVTSLQTTLYGLPGGDIPETVCFDYEITAADCSIISGRREVKLPFVPKK